MIKAIIFDCFGVFYTDPISEYMYRPSTLPNVASALHKLDARLTKGELDKTGFVREAGTLLHIPQSEVDEHFFRPHDRNQALAEFARGIHKRYKTALLSNVGAGIMDSYFSPEETKALFDVVVLSAEVGLAKPDPAIFKLTCQKLGVSFDEAVMVDDVPEYIDAAKALGMQGICYKGFPQFLQEWAIIEGEPVKSSQLTH